MPNIECMKIDVRLHSLGNSKKRKCYLCIQYKCNLLNISDPWLEESLGVKTQALEGRLYTLVFHYFIYKDDCIP